MIPAPDIDQLLLSFCNERWQKVAKVVGKTLQTCEERGFPVVTAAAEIDARMAVLVDTRQLEAKGSIQCWRYSEVRRREKRQEAS
jgi:hypothetical protein